MAAVGGQLQPPAAGGRHLRLKARRSRPPWGKLRGRAAQSLAFQQRPLLEGRAAVEIEAAEKVAAIKRHGRGKLPGGKMPFKLPGIQFDDGIGVERKLLARDQQIGFNLPAQAVEGNVQVRTRLLLRPLRPQQLGEFIASQGAVLAGQGRPAVPRQDGSQNAAAAARRLAQR